MGDVENQFAFIYMGDFDKDLKPRAVLHGRQKGFSFTSLEALTNLGKTDMELKRIEARVGQLTQIVHAGASATEFAEIRTELASLESQAKQLETTGIDDVHMGELSSGKADA